MEEQELRGERTLLPDEVSFIYGVHRQDERLQFTMKNDVSTDDVFGMEPGTDDDVTMYASYDLKRGEISDTLDVKVFGKDGSKTYCVYRLSPEEKKLLLAQMQPYCLELTGMRLEVHRERFQLEQDGLLPDPQGKRPDAMKHYERQRRLAESGNGERFDDNEKYEITDFAHPDYLLSVKLKQGMMSKLKEIENGRGFESSQIKRGRTVRIKEQKLCGQE